MNLSVSTLPTCFALLDDDGATAQAPRSRLYTGYVDTLCCGDAAELGAFFEKLEQALHQGLHAVGLFSYELGVQLHHIPPGPAGPRSAGPRPAGEGFEPSQILLFRHCQHLSAEEVGAWLDTHAGAGEQRIAGVAGVRASVSEQEFNQAIERIHQYLEAGHTYQVNYTYRLRFDAYGAPLALYRRLRQRQPVPYGALIALPDGRAVLSLSPELFVRHEQGRVTVRPMKGTAPASGDVQRDAKQAQQLSADEKNRAENIMIVDLLRNDLGRIANVGSVKATELFAVQRFGSVLQMTSTVQADLPEQTSLEQIFTALYPCGSITGAPKRRTMEIIHELEGDARGIYTGAIGWFDRPENGRRVGDFCLSVPIRTLLLRPLDGQGIRRGEMGVGAGIVHDSQAAAEYAECRLKAQFLTRLEHEFELFETIRASREGCGHLERHLQRLSASAAYFGFAYDEMRIRAELAQHCARLGEGAYRLRLALDFQGRCAIQSAPLAPIQAPVRLLLSAQPTEAGDLFLRHKTTLRSRYDEAWRSAEAQGAFDMLFFNSRGELTEGGRTNVFLMLDGAWYTPPLASGLLPGVMRAVLLDDPAWNAKERVLTRQDLARAQQIVVCNALRGVLRAELVASL